VSVNFGRASPEFMLLMLMLMLGHCRVWSQMLVCVRCCVCVRALCVCLCAFVWVGGGVVVEGGVANVRVCVCAVRECAHCVCVLRACACVCV